MTRRHRPLCRHAAMAVAGVVLCAVANVARAQDSAPTASPSSEALLRRLEALERETRVEMEALRTQIARQAQELAALREGSAQALSAAATAPPPRLASSSAPAAHDTFNRERETVARVDNVPIDPDLVGFFAIPNTPARLKIDGYAKLDALVDPRPVGNADLFNVGGIPIGLSRAEQVTNTNIHARQTRLHLDFRSPTVLSSEFRAFAEIDFLGSSGPVDPRMRHFYGQVSNVLLGQTWTTFTDVDAFPDQLDLAGPAGADFVRQPQVRYTHPLARGQSLAFGVERSEVQAAPIAGTGASYTPAPDLIVRYRFERPHGHAQVGWLSRALGYRSAAARRTYYGYAVSVSGGLKFAAGDHLVASVIVGRGAARYVDNISGLGADLDVGDDGASVTPLPVLGTYAAYTHRWTLRLRSTAVLGYSSIGNTRAQAATAYRSGAYASGNLLFNLAGSLDLGVEYLFGLHEQHDRQREAAHRIQFSAKYDLYRKRPLDEK